MSSGPESVDPREQQAKVLFTAGAALCLVVGMFAVPLGIGFGLWWAARHQLGRREWLVVATGGGIATLFTFGMTFKGYLHWAAVLVFGGDRLAIPYLAVITLAVLVSGLIGALQETTISDRVLIHFRPTPADDLLPDEAEIRRLETVSPPVGEVVVSQDAHSLITGGVPGKRSFPIGKDRSGRPLMLSEEEVKTHMVVLGMTGSGKTEALKNVVGNLADLGWWIVTLDLKEDTAAGGLRDFHRSYAVSHALAYQELAMSSPNTPSWFNPLYGMTAGEAVNTILSLQSFDDGYYQAVNTRMIGQIVTLFYDAHTVDPERYPPPDMYTIGKTLSHPDLKTATKEMRAIVLSSIPGRSEDDFSALAKPSDVDRQTAPGLGARITNMYESEAGRIVLRHGGDRDVMDVTRGGLCYIGLNTLGLSELARVVSTSVLLRLSTLAGARTTGAVEKGDTRIAVIIDEANWIDRTQVQNLLSRARSAGITVVLATQGANDWNDENGQDWEKIINNVNVGIVMRQGGPESAMLCSEYVGKKLTQKVVSQVREGELTGTASVQETEEYHVNPDKLRNLSVGEAIVRVGTPAFRLSWARVAMRDPNLHAGGLVSSTTEPTGVRRARIRPPQMIDGVTHVESSTLGTLGPFGSPNTLSSSEPGEAASPEVDGDGWVSL